MGIIVDAIRSADVMKLESCNSGPWPENSIWPGYNSTIFPVDSYGNEEYYADSSYCAWKFPKRTCSCVADHVEILQNSTKDCFEWYTKSNHCEEVLTELPILFAVSAWLCGVLTLINLAVLWVAFVSRFGAKREEFAAN